MSWANYLRNLCQGQRGIVKVENQPDVVLEEAPGSCDFFPELGRTLRGLGAFSAQICRLGFFLGKKVWKNHLLCYFGAGEFCRARSKTVSLVRPKFSGIFK